jgi:simple sugar transport system permease protein
MNWREIAQSVFITIGALLASVALYSIFIFFYAGVAPLDLFYQIYRGGWSDTFPISNTLTKASPLILTALCTALPARVGLINIGAEGALMMGGLAAACIGLAIPGAPPLVVQIAMVLASMCAGGLLIAAVGWLRTARGVNETISSLLMTYIAIAVFSYLVEGPLRDPASLNKPSTHPLPEEVMLGTVIPESGVLHDFFERFGSLMKIFGDGGVHVGLLFGIVFCVLAYMLMYHTTFGFAARMVGGNMRAAQASGLAVSKIILVTCFLAGAAAGLAGMVEVAFTQRQANASLNANYGFRGILVSFIARHHPLAIIPVAILFGSIDAAASVVQQDLKLPAAALDVLMGTTFVMILLTETLYGRFRIFQPRLAKEVAPA